MSQCLWPFCIPRFPVIFRRHCIILYSSGCGSLALELFPSPSCTSLDISIMPQEPHHPENHFNLETHTFLLPSTSETTPSEWRIEHSSCLNLHLRRITRLVISSVPTQLQSFGLLHHTFSPSLFQLLFYVLSSRRL